MTMRVAVVGVIVLVGLGGAGARADEVIDQIDTAKQYYEEGDFAGAISELQFAIEAMRARTGDLYAQTFPAAPAGWTAGEVETLAAGVPGFGGTNLSRAYTSPDGAVLNAELMIDNPMMQAFVMLLQNPAMMAAQPDMERVRVHKQNAVLRWPGDGTGELTLVVGGRALLKIDGLRLDDKEPLVALMEGWDVDALKAAAGL